MARTSTTPTTRTDPPVLPSRIGRLLGEVRQFLLLAVTIAFLIIPLSYNHADPGFTHASQVDEIRNLGGRVDAWLADPLLFVFDASAHWWAVLLARKVWRGWRELMPDERLPRISMPRVDASVTWIGLALILASSMGLEAIRMYSLHMKLPRAPGDVLGDVIGGAMQHSLGSIDGTLALLFTFLVGLSLFFHFSWLSLAGQIGAGVEMLFVGLKTRRESKQDRVIGEAAKVEREEIVETRRVRIEESPPVQIVHPTAVVKSERVECEKQQPLFVDTHDSDLPPPALLDPIPPAVETVSAETLEFTSRLIEKKLKDFDVEVQVVATYPGPVITRHEIEPAAGVKGSQIVNLAKDLARSLSLVPIRVVETAPGKNCMGLELSNPKHQAVRLSEILGSQVYNESVSQLTLALGKDIVGKSVVTDLAEMPHCMVAGTMGSGKSVGINATILSLLYKAKADAMRLVLIDPKTLELSIYEGIPHLLCPIVTDMRQAGYALSWAVNEMERRYKLMSKMGVRNLAGFNEKIEEAVAREEGIPNPFSLTSDAPEPLDKLPMTVIVIDGLADLMVVVGKKVEELIARIAQKARAAGTRLVLATQRPSADVITGLIKANVSTWIAFQISSRIDSCTILDQQGAEALLGMGDMLYLAPGTGLPVCVHGTSVSDEEVHRIVDNLKAQGEPNYIEGILEGGVADGEGGGDGSGGGVGLVGAGGGEADPLCDQAVDVTLKNRHASISLVQRHLRIGYNHAARLLEDAEKAGLVSAVSGNGNREILALDRNSNVAEEE